MVIKGSQSATSLRLNGVKLAIMYKLVKKKITDVANQNFT